MGRDAYSAVSLFSPMVNMLLLFASSIAVGGMVTRLARDVRYANTFNSNCTMILL